MNRTDFAVFKHLTNEVDFLVKDYDKKPQNLNGKSLFMYVVDERSDKVVLQVELDIIDANKGHSRLVLKPNAISGLDLGSYRYSVTLQRNDSSHIAIYTDQHRSLRGYLEVTLGPLPEHKPSITIDSSMFLSQTWGTPLSEYLVAESFPGAAQSSSANGHHTVAIYTTSFTGDFEIQASLENSPPSEASDWFTVGTESLTNKTGITSIQFVGNYMWIRIIYSKSQINTGSVTKVLLRN